MYMHHGAFFLCQFPNYNSFTQHVIYLLWRDTTSELWTPVLFFFIDNTTYCKHCSHFIHCKQISFSTLYIQSFVFSKTGEIDNLTVPLGQSSLVVLCAGSTLLLTPVVHPAKVSRINTQKCFLSPTGRFNLGFILRENLLPCLSSLPLGVSQRV